MASIMQFAASRDIRIGGAAPDVTNSHGLSARQVNATPIRPMFSVPWLSFDGANLIISGAHLPPQGDPDLLSVQFADGVAGQFEYPLAAPEFGAHYWFWPNAEQSGLRVKINLPASDPGSNPFSFAFVCADDPPDGQAWCGRGRVWIPENLTAFVGHPADPSLLTRVQTWSEQSTVTLTGYNAFRGFQSLLHRHGVNDHAGLHLLDWGCGHGRVTRHFIQHWKRAHITGTDIDAETISWCRANLPAGEFLTAPLLPPTPLAAQRFDAIIGLSVMTHLTKDAQRAWIDEIHRLLKPGGLALITFGGNGAAAYASAHHSQDWWASWLDQGFDDSMQDPALRGKIADNAYYRVTHQTPEFVRAAWTRQLDLLAIETQAFGYQDVAILQRPGR